jgi:hypothetical protein
MDYLCSSQAILTCQLVNLSTRQLRKLHLLMELSVNKLTSRQVNESELPVLTIFVANKLLSLVNSFTCQLVNLESYIY